jgi:hypothetical protein
MLTRKDVEFDLKQAKDMLDNRETPVDELRFMVNKLAYKLKVATAEPESRFTRFGLAKERFTARLFGG